MAARAGSGVKVLDYLWTWLTCASSAKSRQSGGGKGKGGGSGEKRGGVSVDATDVWGRSALHWAAINGHGSEVLWLLEQGCDPSIKDFAGETALEMAERRARCGAKDRNNGERASTFGSIAKILGGSGSTKSLKSKGYYAEK